MRLTTLRDGSVWSLQQGWYRPQGGGVLLENGPNLRPSELLARLRALLLRALYSIRSERQLVERIDYDLLFRRLGIEDPVWDATTFTKNRDRLLR
jgi:transposase